MPRAIALYAIGKNIVCYGGNNAGLGQNTGRCSKKKTKHTPPTSSIADNNIKFATA